VKTPCSNVPVIRGAKHFLPGIWRVHLEVLVRGWARTLLARGGKSLGKIGKSGMGMRWGLGRGCSVGR